LLSFLFTLLLTAQFVNAQQLNPELPGKIEEADSTGHVLKSTNAGTWNALSNGSDYYIYFTWTGVTNSCPCHSGINIYFYRSGISSAVASQGSPAANYSGTGVHYSMGPNQTGSFTFKAPYTGHTYLISSSFDCIYSCSGDWHSTGAITRSTSYIKSPTNVQASDSESDTYIKVTWDKGTDVPNSNHGYKIYRDNMLVDSIYNVSSYEWYDYDVTPGETHTYKVTTYTVSWGGQESWGYSDTGSTFFLNPTAEAKTSSVVLTWNNPQSIGATSIKIERNDGQSTIGLDVKDAAIANYTDDTGIPGYEYTYIITPLASGKTYVPAEVIGHRMPNGKISGYVRTVGNSGVPGVEVCAVRQNDIPQSDTDTYCDTTNSQGYYELSHIYYYESATFTITPKKEKHGFSPSFLSDVTLEQIEGGNYRTNMNFTDTSSFSVRGHIYQVLNGDTCNLPGVSMEVNDLPTGAVSDAEGKYALTVENAGKYTIKPVLENHTFAPASRSYNIDQDLIKINFEDTATFVLDGHVWASCGIYIGQAKLHIYSQANPASCFDTTVMTDTETGYYHLRLPGRPYYVELVEFTPSDPSVTDKTEVEGYFNTEEADLTDGDITRNFTYRKAPSIMVDGFYNMGCGDYRDIPIVQQNRIYPLKISVLEAFGDQSCLTDTGYVIIYNGLVNGSVKVDTLMLQDGVAHYDLIPGNPNIIAPYKKLLQITANVEGQTDDYSQEVLITGNRPREQTFVSVSPEIPFLILRDPPGDGSFSFMSKGTSTEKAVSFMAKQDNSVTVWDQLKAGVKFEAGFGVTVETSIWGSIKASMEVGASISTSDEFRLNITNTEDFATSGNSDITGKNGDVFVGSSLNMIYALTDIIKFDSTICSVDKSVDIIMGTESFNTTFMYTEDHIRNVLIPQLTQLRDLYQNEGSDSAKLYENQIKVWQQTLNNNEEEKKKAAFIENRSFSAGVDYTSTEEITTTQISSVEFNMFVNDQVAIEAGLEIGGVGFSGGVEATFRMDLGNSKTSSLTTTTKTGYTLKDDDAGDFYSVDILSDGVYGTPVFKLVSGRSSCPWEPGTQPREGVQLLSDKYTAFEENPNAAIPYVLSLGNISQSDESRMYNLIFLQKSNPDGAMLTLGGSPVQGGLKTPYQIDPGTAATATITVKRGPTAFDYNNLQFVLQSGCDDPAIGDTINLSAHFKSSCSAVSISRPNNGWLINQNDSNQMEIRLDGYELDKLTLVSLQYSPAGTNNWKTDVTFDNNSLDNEYTVFNWNLPDIPDGNFDLRAKVECSDGAGYSSTISGTIDRNGPALFGVPEPADGVYDNGDVISVSFNESINCDRIATNNITLHDLSKGKVYSGYTGCNGNTLIIVPEPGNDDLSGDTIKLEVSGIYDMHDNIMPDTVNWTFRVADTASFAINNDDDTDGDGIVNSEDNCVLSYNPSQDDLDGDGTGDACDDDIDGDGILNVDDNCVYTANPDQMDADSNGIGDVCEATADGDGDGIPNDIDNCPYTYNPDQADTDNDGTGDVCDNDLDGDGVINTADNCMTTANPDQADANNDGIGDACQNSTGIDEYNQKGFMLYRNYPNPFSDYTIIRYSVPVQCRVILQIFNALGEQIMIKQLDVNQGEHDYTWKTAGRPNGIYFYSISAKPADGSENYWNIQKMVLKR